MGDNNEKIKWLKIFLQLLIFSWLCVGTYQQAYLIEMSPDFEPPPCPEREEFRACFSNCTDCEDRGYCLWTDCEYGRCDCIRNHYRLEPDGPCVPVAMCPVPECPENEVFRNCGPVCEWCGTLRCREIDCESKCYCKEGYFRNYEGICVPSSECPDNLFCFENEELADSGPAEEYCLHPESGAPANATLEEEDCYCIEGFKRNVHGFCIMEEYCVYVYCNPPEVYDPCPKKCNTTCRNYGDPNCVEDNQCYPGCFCPEGLVMDDFRRCVTLDQCTPGSNPFITLPMPPPPEVMESTPANETAGVPSTEIQSTSDAVTVQSDTAETQPNNEETTKAYKETTPTTAAEEPEEVEEEETTPAKAIATTATPKTKLAPKKYTSSKGKTSEATTKSAKQKNAKSASSSAAESSAEASEDSENA
ncbi:spider silk-constituting element SpiCE-CMa4 [Caerostris extrusa]|uniref:Spider silk-constituting element SpiCE-CMa4 n=1 Tax=Caerostris extrusa TaxID=172846 RepID=A0AAV4YEC8_CAEEX|nr:spider silk-constituting element SpiCE-CMa4 [Caerostris extrusa]